MRYLHWLEGRTTHRERGRSHSNSARWWLGFAAMTKQAEQAKQFLALHQASSPLLMPNPWDLGSAKLLEALGFEALATTSGGFAGALGRLDGSVTRDEAVSHAAAVAAAVDVPVSA